MYLSIVLAEDDPVIKIETPSEGSKVHDEPWPLLRLLAPGSEPMTFVSM
jgi:hypothetical protein